jgi:hypothetical protein
MITSNRVIFLITLSWEKYIFDELDKDDTVTK